MSSTQYIPRSATNFYVWAQQFMSQVDAPGNPLGLSSLEILALDAAWAIIGPPPIPTPNSHHSSTAPGGTNDPATKKFKGLVRQAMAGAKANPNVPANAITNAGGNPTGGNGKGGKTGKPPKGKPTTPANINAIPAGPGKAKIQITDGVQPTATTKPLNAMAAMLYYQTGAVKPTSTAGMKFIQQVGSLTAIITYPPGLTGQTIWIATAWIGTNGQQGPMGTPVQVTVT